MPQDSRHWPTIMVECVLSGTSDPLATQHLDDLLQWLSGTDSRGARRLHKAIVRKPLAVLRARALATEFVDKAYISYHRNPWHVFGLAEQAEEISEEDIRLRYRRLIRVFHPDRGSGDAAWLASRSEKINTAYRELSSGEVTPTDTFNNITGEFVNMDKFNTDYQESSLRDKVTQCMVDMVSKNRDKAPPRDSSTAVNS